MKYLQIILLPILSSSWKSKLINRILITLFCLSIVTNVCSQNWFEGTPNWYYNYEWFCIYQSVGNEKILFQKDTLIQGINMKKFLVKGFRNESGYVYEWENDLIMYEENDKVYEFNNGAHLKLYDFTHEIGDSLTIEISTDGTCDSSITYILDDIETTSMYNISPLRVQKWKRVDGDFVYDEFSIVEKIGAIGNFYFKMGIHFNCGLDQCHPFSFGCYYNPEIESAIYTDVCIDNLSSISSLRIENSKVSIYPNPSNDFLNIKSEIKFDECVVYNSVGKIIYNKVLTNNNEIGLSDLRSGVYFLKLISKQKGIITKSFVKY